MMLAKNIKKLREQSDLSQGSLAELCGWQNAAGRISNYENGSREPNLSDVQIIAKALKTDIGTLLGLPNNIEVLSNVQLLPEISWSHLADHLKICLNGGLPEELNKKHMMRPVEIISQSMFNKNCFILPVIGDAMKPKEPHPDALYNGDRVIIDVNVNPESYDKDVTVLAEIGGDFQLRQFVRDGTKFLLKPLNPDYPTIKVGSDAIIIGVVIRQWRDKFPSGKGIR